MPKNQITYVGYVEDAEEDSGSSINGIASTRKYAISEAPRSPTRSPERPNTGRVRGERRMMHPDSDDESVDSISLSDTDATPRTGPSDKSRPKEPRRSSHKERERERDRSHRELEREHRERERRRRERKHREEEEHRRARADMAKERERERERESRALKKTRPPGPKHSATQPIVQQGGYRRGGLHDDPAAYGVQQPAAPGSRPRAQTRPASYYAGQPPVPDMGWAGPPPPAPFPVGSFPPPPNMFPGPGPGPGGVPLHHGPPPPSPMGMGPPMYFDGPMGPPLPVDNLGRRFDRRPSSAMGFNSPPSMSYMPEEYDEEPRERAARRPPRPKRLEDDRKKMPPPDFIPKRTKSAIPTTGAAFKPPPAPRERPPSRQGPPRPPASHRRSVGFADQQGFDDADFMGEVDLFHDVSPDQRRTALARRRRSSAAYDTHGFDIVPANSRGRRSSIYGSAIESGGVSLEEDKYFDALRYQQDVTGGPLMPLTAESLRKASKRGEVASSRSTRSSGSHDESDYKRSNTTGITQSSAGNNEDFTIKVSGAAVVRVSGAEIECNDGGEITFSSNNRGGPGTSRAGSDRDTSTVYQLEDVRSTRMERKALPHRPRAPSQSDTQSRYAPSHAPYEHAPYERITYEHAPYDPALAASNFY